jgi:hypothetical protein
MKVLLPNYSCIQNPWVGDYRPQIAILCPLSSTENVEHPLTPPTPTNKIPEYGTATNRSVMLRSLYFK